MDTEPERAPLVARTTERLMEWAKILLEAAKYGRSDLALAYDDVAKEMVEERRRLHEENVIIRHTQPPPPPAEPTTVSVVQTKELPIHQRQTYPAPPPLPGHRTPTVPIPRKPSKKKSVTKRPRKKPSKPKRRTR